MPVAVSVAQSEPLATCTISSEVGSPAMANAYSEAWCWAKCLDPCWDGGDEFLNPWVVGRHIHRWIWMWIDQLDGELELGDEVFD